MFRLIEAADNNWSKSQLRQRSSEDVSDFSAFPPLEKYLDRIASNRHAKSRRYSVDRVPSSGGFYSPMNAGDVGESPYCPQDDKKYKDCKRTSVLMKSICLFTTTSKPSPTIHLLTLQILASKQLLNSRRVCSWETVAISIESFFFTSCGARRSLQNRLGRRTTSRDAGNVILYLSHLTTTPTFAIVALFVIDGTRQM